LTTVTIGSSVTSIGRGAFRACSGLTAITIPDSVTNIENYTFDGCSGLTEITIGNSVTNIGEYAFSYCSGLTTVTIPDSVTSIGQYAFENCSGLTEITIGNSVTNIGSYAFNYCYGLTEITIGNSVTNIGWGAFRACSGLTAITIPDSVTNIENYTFDGCSGLTEITIGNSVTSIGRRAFSYCSGLTTVTIPDSVTSIGDYAFQRCRGLYIAYFLGDAPNMGVDVFSEAHDSFQVCYTPEATGFTTPEWEGYPVAACACSGYSDCAEGEGCVEGICVNVTCTETWECPEGGGCEESLCTEEAPPVMGYGPFLAAWIWPVLATSEANAFTLTQNYNVLWTFDDDYSTCEGFCTNRAKYRRLDGTQWFELPAELDSTGKWAAFVELPVNKMQDGTYLFQTQIVDCAGQITTSRNYYFKVAH